MVLVLGAAALGAAQLFTGRFRGLVWLALGLWGAAVVRPHMALIVGAGLAVAAPIAVLRGGAHRQGRQRGRLGGAVLVLALLLAGSTLIGVAENFFGLESLNTETAQEMLDEVNTTDGGGRIHLHGSLPEQSRGIRLGRRHGAVPSVPRSRCATSRRCSTALEGRHLLVLFFLVPAPPGSPAARASPAALRGLRRRVHVRLHLRLLERRELRHPRPAARAAAPGALRGDVHPPSRDAEQSGEIDQRIPERASASR